MEHPHASIIADVTSFFFSILCPFQFLFFCFTWIDWHILQFLRFSIIDTLFLFFEDEIILDILTNDHTN